MVDDSKMTDAHQGSAVQGNDMGTGGDQIQKVTTCALHCHTRKRFENLLSTSKHSRRRNQSFSQQSLNFTNNNQHSVLVYSNTSEYLGGSFSLE